MLCRELDYDRSYPKFLTGLVSKTKKSMKYINVFKKRGSYLLLKYERIISCFHNLSQYFSILLWSTIGNLYELEFTLQSH